MPHQAESGFGQPTVRQRAAVWGACAAVLAAAAGGVAAAGGLHTTSGVPRIEYWGSYVPLGPANTPTAATSTTSAP